MTKKKELENGGKKCGQGKWGVALKDFLSETNVPIYNLPTLCLLYIRTLTLSMLLFLESWI